MDFFDFINKAEASLVQVFSAFVFVSLFLSIPVVGPLLAAATPDSLYYFGLSFVATDLDDLLVGIGTILGIYYVGFLLNNCMDKKNAGSGITPIMQLWIVRLFSGLFFFLSRFIPCIALSLAQMTGLPCLIHVVPLAWTLSVPIFSAYQHYINNPFKGATIADSLFFGFEMGLFSFFGSYAAKGYDTLNPFATSAFSRLPLVQSFVPALSEHTASVGSVLSQLTTDASVVYLFSRSFFPQLPVSYAVPSASGQGDDELPGPTHENKSLLR